MNKMKMKEPYFKTPSGKIINSTNTTWLDLAKFSNENGWFEYWEVDEKETTRFAFIVDHMLLGYFHKGKCYLVKELSSYHKTSCSTKEEFERYLKLQSFV